MKKTIQLILFAGSAALMALAQGEGSSVDSILRELNAAGAEPVAAESTVPEPAPAAVETPAADDVPARMEKSRQQYVAGNYEAAMRGFASVLKSVPEHSVARYYMDQIAEYRRRGAEEQAMDTVRKTWNGLLLRDFALSASARRSLGLSTDAQSGSIDVRSKFPEIDFPDGARAYYRPQFNRLFVLNTRHNLKKLEALMASMEEPREGDPGQVEIEARFVEFTEGALEELGFNWSESDNGDNVRLSEDWAIADGQDLFSDALRTVPFSQTGELGLGEVRPGAGEWRVNRLEDFFNSSTDGAGTAAFSGDIGGNTINLLLRALDQTAGADVLSAPSVTTLSGEEAVITVGERHFYPEKYEAGVSQGTVLHVRYEDFKEKILGVQMDVTPTIKGDEIQMQINPRINDLVGWQQFELAPADTSYTWDRFRIGQQFEHEPVRARLPIIKRRELDTEVVVNDGATVGMGGLIGEKTEAFKDRVPVLGSIPLVGRLFRSEGERTVKRNLMIFVTARKVQPSGARIAQRSFE